MANRRLIYKTLTAIISGIIIGYAIGNGWYYVTDVTLIVAYAFIFLEKYLHAETIFAILLAASLPWVNEFGYGPFELGFTVYPAYIFAFFGMAFMTRNMIKTKKYPFFFTSIDKYLLLLLYVLIISTVQSRFIPPLPDIPQASANSIFNKIPWIRSFAQVAAILYMALIYFFVVNAIRTKREFIIVLKTLFFSGAILSIYGVISYSLQYNCNFLGDPYNLYYGNFSGYFNTMKKWFGTSPIYTNGLGNKRISAFFPEPMLLSMYLVSFAPIACSLILVKQKGKNRFCLLGVILLTLLTLFLTFSRSGWLAFFASIIIIAIFHSDRFKRNKKKFIFCALIFLISGFILILLISGIFPNSLNDIKVMLKFQSEGMLDFSRIKQIMDGYSLTPSDYREAEWSALLRINDSIAGIRMWLDHPFLGIGWGNYIFHYPKYDPHIVVWTWEKSTPVNSVVGNLYVNFLAETGLSGFVIFLLIIFKFIGVLVVAIKSARDIFWQALLTGYLGSFVAVFISYFFTPTFYFTFVWVMMAMAMVAVRLSKEENYPGIP